VNPPKGEAKKKHKLMAGRGKKKDKDMKKRNLTNKARGKEDQIACGQGQTVVTNATGIGLLPTSTKSYHWSARKREIRHDVTVLKQDWGDRPMKPSPKPSMS